MSNASDDQGSQSLGIKASTRVTGPYLESLHEFWNGRPQSAVDQITQTLAGEVEHPQTVMLYRLWIAVLADMGEPQALRALADHLLSRGESEPNNHLTYAALRGLIHLELDEYEAANLMADVLSGHLTSHAVLEFLAFYDQRTKQSLPLLVSRLGSVTDYCQLETVAHIALVQKQQGVMQEVLQRIHKLYPSSPLPMSMEVEEAIQKQEFYTAVGLANQLADRWPLNSNFHFLRLYSLWKAGDYEAMHEKSQQLLSLTGDTDPDVATLLAHCYTELAKKNPSMKNHAQEFMRKAYNLRRENALPTDDIYPLLSHDKKSKEEIESLEMRPTRSWLVKLSQSMYNLVATRSENSLKEIFYPIGGHARPGDLCFFAAEAPEGSHTGKSWRIVAIFTVASEPLWDPVAQYQHQLELVSRPPYVIPIDVAHLDSEQDVDKRRLPKEHPYRFHTYELEDGALDIITAAVKRRREEFSDGPERISLRRSS